MALQNVEVVLVNTSHPGNIGAAARAMKNMGLSRMTLVKPRSFPDPEATSRASGAGDILEQARVVSSLQEALGDAVLVLGTSARDRHIPWPLLDPEEAASLVLTQMLQGKRAALVFGREYAGLTNDELESCQYHIHIPTDPDFSSLNLAASVQVLAYEIRKAWLRNQQLPGKRIKEENLQVQDAEVCSHKEMEQYYVHLQHTLEVVGFLHPDRPRHLMTRLRRLYNRAEVTRLEMNILRGILTETCKKIGNHDSPFEDSAGK